MNHSESENCCKRQKGFSLPRHLNEDDGKNIIGAMKLSNMTVVWIDRRRNNLGWTWTNGTRLEYPFGDTHNNCGSINSVTKKLEAVQCFTKNMGFICERKDCESCLSLGPFRKNCQLLAGVCYVAFCGTENWYAARSTCTHYRLDFATVPSNETLLDLVSLNVFLKCPKSWIGLRTTEWGYSTSYAHWGPSEPSDRGNCVVGYREWKYQLRWRVAACHSRHNFTCLNYDSNIFEGTTTMASISGNTTSQLHVILPSVLVPVCICFGVALFLWKKERGKLPGCMVLNQQREKRLNTSRKNANEEESPETQQLCDIPIEEKDTGIEDGSGGKHPYKESNQVIPTTAETQGAFAAESSMTRYHMSTKLVACVFVNYREPTDGLTLRVKIFAINANNKETSLPVQFPEYGRKFLHIDDMDIFLKDSNSFLNTKIQVSEKWEVPCPEKNVPVDKIIESSEHSSWTILLDCNIKEYERDKKENHLDMMFIITEVCADGSRLEPQICPSSFNFDQLETKSPIGSIKVHENEDPKSRLFAGDRGGTEDQTRGDGATQPITKSLQTRYPLSTKLTAVIFGILQEVADGWTLRVKMLAVNANSKESAVPIKASLLDIHEQTQAFLHIDDMEIFLEDSNSFIHSKIQVPTEWDVQYPEKKVPVDKILESSERSSWTTLLDCKMILNKRNNEDNHMDMTFTVTEVCADGSILEAQICPASCTFKQENLKQYMKDRSNQMKRMHMSELLNTEIGNDLNRMVDRLPPAVQIPQPRTSKLRQFQQETLLPLGVPYEADFTGML